MSDNQQNLGELQSALEEARNALAAEGQPETGTGGKQQQFTSEAEELEALRAEKRERDEREAVQRMVGEVAQGVKAKQAQEEQRLQQLVADELRKALGGQDVQGLVSNAIVQASQTRLGRKFVADGTGDAGVGYKGGGAYIPQHRLGEKASFATFLRAVGRKDRGSIGDIQRTMGMEVGYGTRALVSGGGAIDAVSGPSGGFVVPVEWGRDVIARLVPQVVVRRAGAVIQTMQSPVFRQPRLTGGASAAWVGETAAIASSQPTFDQFALTAKKLAALVPVSNELLMDSDPAIAEIVTRDMALAIGLKEDQQYLVGAGSSIAPTGLLNVSGITTSAQSAAPDYDMVVGMVIDLAAANVPEINRAWVAHPYVLRSLMEIKDSDGRPIFTDYMNVQVGTLNQRVPTLYGYPVFTSTQMTYTAGSPNTGSLALIDFGYVVLGQHQELELRTSDEANYVDGSNNSVSAWQQDLTLFRALIRTDLSPTHAGAISVRTAITV